MRSEQQTARRQCRIRDSLLHGIESSKCNVAAGLLNRGKRDREKCGETQVVEADDSQVARHFDVEACERLQELRGGVVVGADDGVVLATCGEFADELHVAGIASMKEVTLDGEAVRQHRGSGSGFAGIDGGGGEGASDEGETFGSEFDKVIGEEVTAREVVDAYEVEVTASREGADVAINQHDGDARVAETLSDSVVRGFVVCSVLEGREEHSTDTGLDITRAEFLGLLDAHELVGARSRAAAPEHAEIIDASETGEFAADNVEDFDAAKSRHDEAKLTDAGAGIAIFAKVSA